MPRVDHPSLWNSVNAAGNLPNRFIAGANATVRLSEVCSDLPTCGRAGELRGQSVLVATTDQLAAALALIELDGVARRLVLWPADLAPEHRQYVIDTAAVNTVVSDWTPADCGSSANNLTRSSPTEWILLTSGTTGRPKLVVHTLSSLCGAIEDGGALSGCLVWSTFYDIRRYGGLQIFLRAMLTGGSIVLSSAQESTAQFLDRAGAHGITHISGTPSHWRRALMSPSASAIQPQYVRLSGEIADQGILDKLRLCYPQAGIGHAFASTEAGVAFEVRDGLEGFPARLMEQQNASVGMKGEDGLLHIRSSRTAARYLGEEAKPLVGADGFVDTGDVIELRGDRYYFVGRRDGVINVGGLKVHPEEVEAVINRHPGVRMSQVRPRKNPLVGSLVVADVVPQESGECGEPSARRIENEIVEMCREALPRHKVPAIIRVVDELEVAATGKIVRHHA